MCQMYIKTPKIMIYTYKYGNDNPGADENGARFPAHHRGRFFVSFSTI